MVITIAFVLLWGPSSWRWYVNRHQLFIIIGKPHIFLNSLYRILSQDKIPSSWSTEFLPANLNAVDHLSADCDVSLGPWMDI